VFCNAKHIVNFQFDALLLVFRVIANQ